MREKGLQPLRTTFQSTANRAHRVFLSLILILFPVLNLYLHQLRPAVHPGEIVLVCGALSGRYG